VEVVCSVCLDTVELVELDTEVLVELVVLEDENTTNAPIATITTMTRAPITKGAETPRLVRMLLYQSLIFYIKVDLGLF
jgi:hypothetical protein